MKLTAKVNRHSHIRHWIKLWNGGLQLTNKEQLFFGELLYRAMDMLENGVKEPYLSQLLFSGETMKEIAEKLDITAKGLQNYKYQLVEKKAITKTETGYVLKPALIPRNSITFEFVYND